MNDKKIIVFGKFGQVGQSLAMAYGPNAQFFDRHDADFETPSEITQLIINEKPDVVINASAYTNVEQAESDRGNAFLVNATAPGEMAKACSDLGALLVQYSTDYVFDGTKDGPYTENDPTNPINIYGESKLAGEQNVISNCDKHIILRTSWVYSPFGTNFLKTMLTLAKTKENLKIVNDQIGTPTSAYDIALATKKIVEKFLIKPRTKEGVFNLTNQGFCSWHEWADAIFKIAREKKWAIKLKSHQPVSSDEFPTKAKRPNNSRLDCRRVNERFDIALPNWFDSVKFVMETIDARRET